MTQPYFDVEREVTLPELRECVFCGAEADLDFTVIAVQDGAKHWRYFAGWRCRDRETCGARVAEPMRQPAAPETDGQEDDFRD